MIKIRTKEIYRMAQEDGMNAREIGLILLADDDEQRNSGSWFDNAMDWKLGLYAFDVTRRYMEKRSWVTVDVIIKGGEVYGAKSGKQLTGN